MSTIIIPPEIEKLFESIVARYKEDIEEFEHLSSGLLSLFNNKKLRPLIHSMKVRVKDPAHLTDKLRRKYIEAMSKNEEFQITLENAYEKVTDLVGLRILHLHTRQFEEINKVVLDLLNEEVYEIVEGPCARYWDNEYRDYFTSVGIQVEANQRLYTSVHYTVKPTRKTLKTGEIQIRTLAEELWGEVDHSINYPHRTSNVSVQEQLLVLARVTSSCTRLVDSIFKSIELAR